MKLTKKSAARTMLLAAVLVALYVSVLLTVSAFAAAGGTGEADANAVGLDLAARGDGAVILGGEVRYYVVDGEKRSVDEMMDAAGTRYLSWLEPDVTGAVSYLYLSEPGKTDMSRIGVLDGTAWTYRDLTDGRFRYNLDDGLLSESNDGVRYVPVMYVIDGKAYGIEELRALETVTMPYAVETDGETGDKRIDMDGYKFVQKDGTSLAMLTDMLEEIRYAPTLSRTFDKSWTYVSSHGAPGVAIDTMARTVTFSVDTSVSELPRESVLAALEYAIRLDRLVSSDLEGTTP